MTKQINVQPASTPIVDKMGRPTIEFFSLIEALTGLEIIEGDSDPNGALIAKRKTIYWQRTANTLWFKTTGPDLDSGWLQISSM